MKGIRPNLECWTIFGPQILFLDFGHLVIQLGLGFGPSLRKGKKVFYPNLDSQCESGLDVDGLSLWYMIVRRFQQICSQRLFVGSAIDGGIVLIFTVRGSVSQHPGTVCMIRQCEVSFPPYTFGSKAPRSTHWFDNMILSICRVWNRYTCQS